MYIMQRVGGLCMSNISTRVSPLIQRESVGICWGCVPRNFYKTEITSLSSSSPSFTSKKDVKVVYAKGRVLATHDFPVRGIWTPSGLCGRGCIQQSLQDSDHQHFTQLLFSKLCISSNRWFSWEGQPSRVAGDIWIETMRVQRLLMIPSKGPGSSQTYCIMHHQDIY